MLQWSWYRHGQPIWIRTWFAGTPEDYDAVRAEAAQGLAPFDAVVPPIIEFTDAETVCLDRLGWADPDVAPADDIVRRFVESSLVDALASGRCVIAGEAHVLPNRCLVVEDVGGIYRLEAVDRAVLLGAVEALVAGSTTRLESVIAAATGGLDDRQRWIAKRCATGSLVEWSPLGFILALRTIARTLLEGGSSHATAFAAVADEIAHRANLAHRHRCPRSFASPTGVHKLLERAS